MASSYLLQNTLTVCTFQTDPSPKKIIATRSQLSVGKSSQDLPLLTRKDRNLDVQFACKSPMASMASFFAMAAGILIGVAVIASGPVGWAIAGAAAVACIAAGTYQATQIKHKCTPGLEGGDWMLYHNTVKFDKSEALIQTSLLSCKVGGMLTPILDPATAATAAKEISDSNMIEVYTNAAISLVAGILLPTGISGIAGASTLSLQVMGGVKMLGGMIGGMAFIQTATWGQRSLTREYSLEGNESYDRLNEQEGNSLLVIPQKPSDFDDINQLFDLKEAYKSGTLISENVELQSRLSKIRGLSRQQLYRNPAAVQLLKDLKAGRFASGADGVKINPSRINPTTRGQLNATNRQNSLRNLRRFGGKSVSGIMFFAPFFATYFSEEARKSMAIAMEADISSQGDILSNTQ